MIQRVRFRIEWETDTNSMSNGPSVKRAPSGTTFTFMSGAPGSDWRWFEQRRRERRRIDRHFSRATGQ